MSLVKSVVVVFGALCVAGCDSSAAPPGKLVTYPARPRVDLSASGLPTLANGNTLLVEVPRARLEQEFPAFLKSPHRKPGAFTHRVQIHPHHITRVYQRPQPFKKAPLRVADNPLHRVSQRHIQTARVQPIAVMGRFSMSK